MIRMSVISLVALVGAGCASDRTAQRSDAQTSDSAISQAAPSPAPAQGGMAAVCPMNVPGTRVSAEDTDSGVALSFTTSPDRAPALRERVHAMARMHNAHHGEGGMGGMHQGGMHHGGMHHGRRGETSASGPGEASQGSAGTHGDAGTPGSEPAPETDGEGGHDAHAGAASSGHDAHAGTGSSGHDAGTASSGPDANAGMGSSGGGAMGGMAGGGMRGMHRPPQSSAAVEELPDGARLVLTPRDPADLDQLRQTVRMRAEHMQEHGCPMMRGQKG